MAVQYKFSKEYYRRNAKVARHLSRYLVKIDNWLV